MNKQNNDDIVGSLVRVKLVIGGNSSGTLTANELSEETAKAHGADAKSLKTSLTWMPAEYRKSLSGATSSLRAGFNSRSLPWEDGGYRVVPADRYQDLVDFVAAGNEELEKQVKRIRDNWDDILIDAKRRLNGTMDKINVPSRDDYCSRFRTDFTPSVVVAPADVRIKGLDEVTLNRIRLQVKQEIGTRLNEGIKSLGRQLVEILNDLQERINKDEQKGIRYEGWIKWAKATVAAIRPLNITGDKAVEELARQVEKIAESMDSHSLRNSGPERSRVKKMIETATLEAFCE